MNFSFFLELCCPISLALPCMVLCMGLGAWTFATQGIVILITPLTALAVFGITVAICIGSAVFAIQKVTRVDPAIVFKA